MILKKILSTSTAILVSTGLILTPTANAQTITIPNLAKLSSTSSIPNFTIPQLPQFTPPAPQTPQRVSSAQRAQNIINYTNAKRAQHGLAPVMPNPELQTLAQQWAEKNMHEDRLYHRPQHWTAYPSYIPGGGENILQAWSDYSDKQLVQMWYDSPGHRAKTIGVGVAIAPNGKLYAVQNYGR